MTLKQLKNLKAGDQVMFKKQFMLGGAIVTVTSISEHADHNGHVRLEYDLGGRPGATNSDHVTLVRHRSNQGDSAVPKEQPEATTSLRSDPGATRGTDDKTFEFTKPERRSSSLGTDDKTFEFTC